MAQAPGVANVEERRTSNGRRGAGGSIRRDVDRSTRLAIAGVLLATVLQAIDGSIVNVAVPHIQRTLQASLAQVSWTVTAYVLASVIAMPLAASIAARTGLRPYFIGSVILFTVASAACGLAQGPNQLIAFRVVQGFGGGALLPLSQGILMSLFPRERRGTAVALVGVAAVLGPLFGPPLGGLLTDHFGWPSIFFVNLPLGLVSIALLAGNLRAPKPSPPKGPLDLAGGALLAGSLVCLQTACAHHPLLFLPALVLGVLFVLHERRTPFPAVDLGVLRHGALRATLASAPLYGVSLYGSVFLAPLLLERELNLSAGRTGLIMAAGGAMSGVVILCARPLLTRVRARTLCGVGASLFAVSMLAMAFIAERGAGEVVLPQVLRGLGTGLLYVGMNGFAFESVAGEDLAVSASLFYLLRQLGGSLGVALVASALDRFGREGTVAAFAALAVIAPLSLWPMAAAAPDQEAQPAQRRTTM